LLKWVLLFLGLALAYWWLVAKKKSKNQAANKKVKQTEPSPVRPQRMVSCSYCDLHLPESDAIAHHGRYYCSTGHRDSISQKGWWGKAQWLTSVNFDERPSECDINLVVIHHISLPPGQFGGRYIIDFFQNNLNPTLHPYFEEIANQRVSSHFLIDRNGKTTQFVSIHKRAWHAGVSQFEGRERCNDFSIGIELEGDDQSSYTNEQYLSLAELIRVLGDKYPQLQFAGHSDIAPERKIDPGKYFDWKRLQQLAQLKDQQLPFGNASR
jgi:N-acetyl-anhydromuramoyl-L-alanine amidase